MTNTIPSLAYGHSENPDVYNNEPHWLIMAHPETSDGRAIADVEQGKTPEAEWNARRLVASWNALKDVPLEVIEKRPDAAQKPFHLLAACMYALHELEAGRTELAAATLREAVGR